MEADGRLRRLGVIPGHQELRALFDAPTVRLLSAQVEDLVLARVQSLSDDEALRLLEQESRV